MYREASPSFTHVRVYSNFNPVEFLAPSDRRCRPGNRDGFYEFQRLESGQPGMPEARQSCWRSLDRPTLRGKDSERKEVPGSSYAESPDGPIYPLPDAWRGFHRTPHP
jgi:hypothetical protein